MTKAAKMISHWRQNAIEFVRDVFKIEPDVWQKNFLKAYTDNNRVAAKACKGPGKTAVLSWCAWHFLVCYPHAKLAATSITGENLRDGLWSEMAKWQQRSPLLQREFTWRAERITANCSPETWFMSARRWSKDSTGEQQANALAGLHADYIMYILDEAGGIPDAVMAAAEAIMANAGSDVNPTAVAKILICGNPTHLSGPLYRACSSEASLWHVIEITGDPDDPKRSPRISKKWAQEQILKYGRDNPWVLVNVFGKFPPSSLNALLGPDDLTAAMNRTVPLSAYNRAPRILSVDVARHGDDRSVIAPRQGLVAFRPRILRIPDTKQLAGAVAQAINKFEPDAVFVDGTGGWGWGVIDNLNDWGYAVTPVQYSSSAMDRQFLNLRAEFIWNFAAWVKGGGCLPNIPELKEEALAVTYSHQRDMIKIVEKDQIKDEIGRSPDLFDAYAQGFAYPVARKSPEEKFKPKGHDQRDYDPVHEGLADYNPLV